MIVHIVEITAKTDIIEVLTMSPEQLVRLLLEDMKEDNQDKYNFVLKNGSKFRYKMVRNEEANSHMIYLGCELPVESEIFYEITYK